METFDATAASSAADAVTPPASPDAPAGTSSPAVSKPAPATPAAPPAKAVPHLTEQVAVEFIDQGLYMVLKRKAKKLGLRVGPQDRDALRLSDTEKEELLLFSPGIMPYIEQYADLIGKASLALFGFALWSIYKDKSDTLELAAKLAAEQAKGPRGFGPRPGVEGGGGPGPAAPFDPSQVKGIPPYSG